MKEIFKRCTSVLLTFTMVFSICMVSVNDVQAEEVSEKTSEEMAETLKEDDEQESDAQQDDSTTQSVTEDEPEQSVVDESVAIELSDVADDESVDNDSADLVVETYSLALEYDDYYSLADFDGTDLSGYTIKEIETKEITSTQVVNGSATSEPDTDVVIYDEETGTIIARGIGSATVILEKPESAEQTQSSEETEESEKDTEAPDAGIEIEVTVKPAKLTLMIITGQSNAEGSSSSITGSKPQDSVLCEEGTVYSTYAPSSSNSAQNNTGIGDLSACTANNADSFVAGSLTGTTSRSGDELVYPLSALTKSGNGKTGMDSGLAYEWHTLTGDKVWTVNAGYSATSITSWIPGGNCYERAKAVLQGVKETANAEFAAGHYERGNQLLFWLQGEDDQDMSVSEYISNYMLMYNGFEGLGLSIDYHGIIIVRAAQGNNTTSADLYMTNPRIAQYLMGNSKEHSNIYVVSNVNEQWVSDSGVTEYFQNAYGNSLGYPLRSNATISGLPTTVSAVHGDIHYSQVAHNENGITAAKNMYHIVNGDQGSSKALYWYDQEGNALKSGAYAEIAANSNGIFIPVSDPLYDSKSIEIDLDSPDLSYDEESGTLKSSDTATGTLTARSGDTSCSIVFPEAQLSTPKLVRAASSAGSISITWDPVDEADGYRVFRRPDGGSWLSLGETEDTSYVDSDKLSIGTKYYYTVRAYRGENASSNAYKDAYWSDFESPGLSATAESVLVTPVLKQASASAGNITVTWKEVNGASGYRVFRRTSDGSWASIGNADKPSYTDDKVSIGTTYYYTVRAYKGDQETAMDNAYYAAYWSDFESPGVSASVSSVLSTPSLISAISSEGSNTVTWKGVDEASGYRVYRRVSGGNWLAVGMTGETTSYTDSDKLDIGTTYYYTVRAYKGDQETALENAYYSAYWSDFESPGVSVKTSVALSTPSLVSATSSQGINTVTWKRVSGASGYRVYRRTSGGNWLAVGITGETTSYTDSYNLDIGTTYYYTVRAYKGDQETALENTYYSTYWSDFESPGVSVKTSVVLSVPTLVSATSSQGVNTITWKGVSGASGYRVYRRVSGGSWLAVGMTDETTSYADSDKLDIGATYYYTVRAYKGDQETALENTYYSAYWSDFESPGITVKTTAALSTPVLVNATCSQGVNTITWKGVSGASGYRVYRRVSGGSWLAVGMTDETTSYADSYNLDIGTTYYYTVRAYKGDQETALENTYYSAYWSDFESAGVSVKTSAALSTPSLVSAVSSEGDIIITWKAVSGADGYRIYRRPSGGSWLSIGETTSSTTYTDENDLQVGTLYYYTVRAYKGDRNIASENAYYSAYWSDFDSSGVSTSAVSELATPALNGATASKAQITVTWSSVSGAQGYRVYRRTSGSNWSSIAETEFTSYTDTTNLSAGETYIYTVRAYKGDYSTAAANTYTTHYWSDFVSDGVSAVALSVLDTPVLKSASKGSSGVTITYGSVSGAGGYRVFRRATGGSWATIGNTTSTSYTDTSTLSSSTTYYYTVRAYVGDLSTASAHAYDVNYWSAFDTNGLKYVSVADVDMYNKAQSYSSSTNYLLLVNSTTNKVGIFTGSKGNWDMKYYWSCSTGKSSTPTKKGTFKIGSKGKSFGGSSYTCWYYSQFSGNYLFHSVLYKKGSMTELSDGRLGMNISHGCVRLAIDNAKWIYDNVPKGSTVVSY